MRSLSYKLSNSRFAWIVCAAIVIASISIVSIARRKPHPWAVDEVPVAFWAWRTQSPDQTDIRAAVDKTRARTLFLRAGQIDYQDGKLRRIRPLAGSFPKGIKLHLVYNATRPLLEQLENVESQVLATEIARAYNDDAKRAEQDGADVGGVQLDIDVPTRLLPRYETTLSALRKEIPQRQQLSITGLPTWMESPALGAVLKRVDFWIPQFYGAEPAQRADQVAPISSPESVTRFVNKARALDRPFYAGLAAYSVALLYDGLGKLVSLRGDIDPALVASDPNLEQIGKGSFDDASSQTSLEWRYVFRARADGITDGLNMKAGDVLVLQTPNAESLRLAARISRELAGPKLLGICVFRLPASTDAATLAIEQVAAALNDRDAHGRIDVRLTRDADGKHVVLDLSNNGATNALTGTLNVDLAIPAGSFESAISPAAIVNETLCGDATADPFSDTPQPCSGRRANVIRLMPRVLSAGQTCRIILAFNREPPSVMRLKIAMQTDVNASYADEREISIERGAVK